MDKAKPYEISKHKVLEAFQRVRKNKGKAGIDDESLEDFEADLKDNLYKIWNRMSSGSYFPPAVKAVEIPKKQGGVRVLGVPTVADRVAQMVVKMYFEPSVEPYFHRDSYGYRAGKSAIDAVAVTRKRCWKYNWVMEFDIKGLFDNIDHELLMKAVRKHTYIPWVRLYVERWLKASFQKAGGTMEQRTKGTPQGGVISPVLANLFLHYAFDAWMDRTHPDKPFARYADDGVVHCKSLQDAEEVYQSLKNRLEECGLEIHPEKSRIVYCKDDDRRGRYEHTSFDFLGYTFRPRRSKNRYGKFFINFTPAVSNKAKKAMRQTIRGWRMHLKSDKSLEDLSRMFNPVIRGWMQYYGHFYKSELYVVLKHMNKALTRWVQRHFKRLKHQRRATHWLGRIAEREAGMFHHWQVWGVRPAAG